MARRFVALGNALIKISGKSVISGFQKRCHNTSSSSKTSANYSDWTKSTSTRNLENNGRTLS
ncbi:hypothetical protein T4D_12570 [Trichinella pseudospiralis]|uniref:Uncharacterized protein n=1 Tax=Trichinella pseudospiralis TaxID=6337 RepID=A0A0V1F6W8_TRIPS|nr:hypothetical protein T4D_10890 [Trichinella pseudospiralis]KRY80963.1 hypothetical protein T4D_12570 [Trichinella pseudospiralis]